MEFSALRHFHETARAGSIRRASEILHVAPSSVSRSISALEYDLGAMLFERSKRGMRLTSSGEVLARHTSQIFRNMERVRSSIDDLRGLRRGNVTLFAPEGLVTNFLPEVIADCQRKHPAITFDVSLGSTDRIVQALIDDEADIGITFNGPQRQDLVIVAEYIEPLCCIVAPRHALAGRAMVALDELANYAFALPNTSFGLRRQVDNALFEVKVRPRIALNCNSLELAKQLVMAGEAITFMPGFMVKNEVQCGQLVTLKVADAALQSARTTVCVHRDRELSFAGSAVLSMLREKLSALKN